MQMPITYPKSTRLVAAAFVMMAAALLSAQSTDKSTNALQTLSHKTGWILLGEATADLKHWAVGQMGDPSVDYFSGTYVILGRTIDRRRPIRPKIGECIRIMARGRIIILDYAVTGEEHRLAPPMMTRGLDSGDDTKLFLERDAVVQVCDVKIAPAAGQIRAVWGRVSPPNQ
jgi:hypothetical protein